MKALVCGGRKYSNRARVWDVLNQYQPDSVVCGGAPGADRLALSWCEANGIPCHVYFANWGRYQRRAGPIRNQQMLTCEEPDIVIAFPGGVGTNIMVEYAKKAGVEVDDLRDEVCSGSS